MPNPLSSIWQPTKIRRIEETYDTGSEVVAVTTDAGRAFVKLRGNKEGPHVLVCEFVGTRLAARLGLPVFEHGTMHYDGTPAIEFPSGNQAEKGTAWITRREEGIPWSGITDDLRLLANPADLALLVAVDQWTRNCDRYRPEPLRVNRNNVFFSRTNAPEGRFRLIAMDFTQPSPAAVRSPRRLPTLGGCRTKCASAFSPSSPRSFSASKRQQPPQPCAPCPTQTLPGS